MAVDNTNRALELIRTRPGRGRPELQKTLGLPHTSGIKSIVDILVKTGFIEERNKKCYPTPKKGVYVRQNPFRGGDVAAARAFEAGQDLPPSHAAQLYVASEMKKAIDAAQRAADAKFVAEAKAAAAHLTSVQPPPPPEPPTSMFEKRAIDSTLSPAEKLNRNLDTALDIDAEIMALGVDRDDAKTTKIVGEASGRTLAAAVRVDEAQLRREDYRLQNLDKLAGLLREKYDDAGALRTPVIEHKS